MEMILGGFVQDTDGFIQSNFCSHGGTAQGLFGIEDESRSDDEYGYNRYYDDDVSPKPSEQVDNSRPEEILHEVDGY